MSAFKISGIRFVRIMTAAGVLAALCGLALTGGLPAEPARAVVAAATSRLVDEASLSGPLTSSARAGVAVRLRSRCSDN